MKKIFFTVLTAATALAFVACNEGTTVKWTAGQDLSGTLGAIQWKDQDGALDQEWIGETISTTGDNTSSLGVEALIGYCDAELDGAVATVTLSDALSSGIINASGQNAQLEENAVVNLVVMSAK